MPYLPDLNTYLHQSSLLIKAYPSTRITTKYSLPRKPNPKARTKTTSTSTTSNNAATTAQPKREPSADLTLKTFHPESGICLKYKTDKAAEVGRLINGLGRLAKGEEINMPSGATEADRVDKEDKMDLDQMAPKMDDKVVTAAPAATQTTGNTGGGSGGKGGKKKKGKK